MIIFFVENPRCVPRFRFTKTGNGNKIKPLSGIQLYTQRVWAAIYTIGRKVRQEYILKNNKDGRVRTIKTIIGAQSRIKKKKNA